MVDERFLTAVALFNSQEFFECHDVLEDLWGEVLDERRDFYQGLLHAAVALYHFSEGNLGGARKMHDSTLRYLSKFEGEFQGLDLHHFRQQFRRCFQKLVQHSGGYPQGMALEDSLIPQLEWTSPPV